MQQIWMVIRGVEDIKLEAQRALESVWKLILVGFLFLT